MNKKLKITLKSSLEDKLPKRVTDLYSLHNDMRWIIQVINDLLFDKYFSKILEMRFISEVKRLKSDFSEEDLEKMLSEDPMGDPLRKVLQKITSEPLFLPNPPEPKAPEKWLQLAKKLVVNENLSYQFNKTYKTFNTPQIAIKLRDLCKDNEEEIEKVMEELRK